MKNFRYIFLVMMLAIVYMASGQVAINKDGSSASSSAILHVKGSGNNNFIIDDNTGYIGMNVPIPEMDLDIYNESSAAFVRLTGIGNDFDYAGIQLWSDESPAKLWQIVHRKEAYMQNYFVIQWTDGIGNWPKRFVIDTDGKVGIGKDNPVEKLHVDGNVRANNFWTPAKAKGKDFQNLDNSMEMVNDLVAFKSTDNEFAIDAVSMQEVLPQLVKIYSDGSQAVSYQSLVPVLVEAVKEQQKIIEDQKSQINELKELLAQ